MSERRIAFAIQRNGYLVVDYTRSNAGSVRRDFGRIYNQPTPELGWKMALKEGFRVVRVTVAVCPTSTGEA